MLAASRSFLLIIGYGFFATLTVFYGVVVVQSLFVTFVGFHLVACLAIPLFHGYLEGDVLQHWREAWGEHAFTRSEGLLFGLLFGFVLLISIIVGFALLLRAGVDPDWIQSVLRHWGLTKNGLWFFIIYMTVVNSLLEELLWRGFVLERLLFYVSRAVAIPLSSFFYALYHFILGAIFFGVKWGLVATILIFLVGNVWGWLKITYQGVYTTWVSHLLADLGIMVILVYWVF